MVSSLQPKMTLEIRDLDSFILEKEVLAATKRDLNDLEGEPKGFHTKTYRRAQKLAIVQLTERHTCLR